MGLRKKRLVCHGQVYLWPTGGARGCQACRSCSVKWSPHCDRSRGPPVRAGPRHWVKPKNTRRNAASVQMSVRLTVGPIHFSVGECDAWAYCGWVFLLFISIYAGGIKEEFSSSSSPQTFQCCHGQFSLRSTNQIWGNLILYIGYWLYTMSSLRDPQSEGNWGFRW